MEKEEFDTVILCNGEFPTHPKALEILHNAKYLCCCDGAAEECLAHGICPDAIVGDGDSLPKELKERYADIVHIVKEQEFNDMTKATRFCKNRGPRIAYLGATGKREDHTVGNIFLLPFYLEEEHVEPVMFTDHGVFIPAKGTRTLRFLCKAAGKHLQHQLHKAVEREPALAELRLQADLARNAQRGCRDNVYDERRRRVSDVFKLPMTVF